MPKALITGGSRGLGRALTNALVERGWVVVVDGRRESDVDAIVRDGVIGVPGDVTDEDHRQALRTVIRELDGVDLLVNNAGALGPSPLPALADVAMEDLRQVYEVNVFAPLAMAQLVPATAMIVNISSDAAVEAYAGWGLYGSSKAALDQMSAVLGVEHSDNRVYAFDPGDMRTEMHASAFPGEDISDRPLPESVVPAFLRLIAGDLPSGRYRVGDLAGGES